MENTIENIVETMIEYLDYNDSFRGYNKKSILKFYKISKKFFKKAKRCTNKADFINLSLSYIESLKKLNEDCFQELLVTKQKEAIISMINNIA